MKKILLSLATLFCIILFSSCTAEELVIEENFDVQTDIIPSPDEDNEPPVKLIPPIKKP